MTCPICGEKGRVIKWGGSTIKRDRQKVTKFKCNACGHMFNNRSGGFFPGTRVPLQKIMETLKSYARGHGIASTARQLQLNYRTVRRIVGEGRKNPAKVIRIFIGSGYKIKQANAWANALIRQRVNRPKKSKAKRLEKDMGDDERQRLRLAFGRPRRNRWGQVKTWFPQDTR